MQRSHITITETTGIYSDAYRLTSTFDMQSDAIAAARQISRNQHSELFIHGRNGQIRERDSHGNDPFPPRG